MQVTTAKPMARGVTHLEYVGDAGDAMPVATRDVAGVAALAVAVFGRKHRGVAALAGIALLWPRLRGS